MSKVEKAIEAILPNLFKVIIMNIDATTFTKDGEYYLVKERTPERSTITIRWLFKEAIFKQKAN